jgi:CHAD domain-containing protein
MAGVARDLDVHRRLLTELSAAQKRTHSDEIARLDAWLQKRRDRAAETLRDQLSRREVKLERALEKVQSHFDHLTAKEKSPSATAQLWFTRAATKSLTGDPEELHDFRKKTKSARYLAEFEASSPAALRLAKRLHQLQDNIGAWHDWELLTQEAKRALPKKALLPELLQSRCENALAAALQSTHKAQPKRSAKKTA